MKQRPSTRSMHAIPCWMVSLVVHGLLSACLLFGYSRRGLPDGSGVDGTDTALNLSATFGVEESSSDPATEVGVELVQSAGPAGAADLEDPGPPPAQELPSDPPSEDDPAVAVAEQDPTMTDAEGPAVPQPAPDSEELLASTLPQNKRPGGLAARLASEIDAEAGAGEIDGTAEASDAGAPGRGARFGSPDGTSFFQINAQGQHFCYVVDCSNSMEEENTIEVARRELRASLLRLDASKKFQIIFYDAELHQLLNHGESVFLATDTNRRLARQFISSQQPTGRAFHMLALSAALRSKPDVIFFLTDGEVPELSARELAELKSSNRRRTQINVVEFGRGAKLEHNWLEQLARDNRGHYRYRDIDVETETAEKP